MKQNKVVSMCPKCSKKDEFISVSSNKRRYGGRKYELRTCPVCGERYLARTYGYFSILRFHGDNFMEQMESILQITPEHCEGFIQQVKECNTESQLLKVVQSIHGDVKPMTNEAYDKMLDSSLMLTEDMLEVLED
ncbi:unknown [Clostridium sp. CAG:411]|jgi:hypothetical protein|nr:hypothetical protein [Lachnospiraceae bacterium]CDE43346.1 unknown [Clostridium sp. CAG:411]